MTAPHRHDAAVAAAVAVARRGRPAAGSETVGDLARRLYAEWYAAPPAGTAGEPDGDVTEALRAACAGARRFQDGWRADRVSSAGRVLAVRGAERRLLHPLDYVCPERPGLPPRAGGGDLLVVDRRDTPEPVEGYWSVFGAHWPVDGDAGPLVRVYWNVAASDGPCLVDTLTRSLSGAPAAWALKLPARAVDYRRPDAAVLYVAQAGFDAVTPRVRAAALALADRLGAAVPPLTLQIAPGVAIADDPEGDESFGLHRCRLVAEALTACDERDGGAVAAVWRRFAAEGIDRRRPHLGPGVSGDRWHRVEPRPIPVGDGASVWPARSMWPKRDGDRSDRAHFVTAAAAIGGRLVDEAIWHEDRCTWLGDALEPVGGHWRVVLRACDGDLYGGTAGVALFLAHAARSCGDAAMARVAAAGARSALRWAEGTAAPAGLHDGAPGAVWAVLEIAATLDDDTLRRAAVAAAEAVCAAVAAAPAAAPDIVAGDAGSILACRGIERALMNAPDGGATEGFALATAAAAAAGRRLMAGARRTPEGWWWPADGEGSAGLCGMAHGASGIATALALLGDWTGEAAYGDAAREAVRWERARFTRAGGGWPDLRDGAAVIPHPAMWCHGAIGIGIARLALHARDRDCATLAEAGAAIQLTRAMLATGAARPADWSLCHGAAGAIELFLRAHEVTGCAEHLTAALRLADVGLASADGAGGTWPCGVPGGGECPGLMLGLAGIGMTLLRAGGAVAAPAYLGGA